MSYLYSKLPETGVSPHIGTGGPASIDAAQVRAMKAQGIGASEIAKALKIGRASVYRVLGPWALGG
jgi:DNA invertase Pin-like site-specific DNA recombinase